MLPIYIPGSIKLEPIETSWLFAEFAFVPTKRNIYYSIPSEFMDIGNPNFLEDIPVDNAIGRQEMCLVTFVKHYKISKQKFKNTVSKIKKYNEEHNLDMTTEQYELPNADIIYTFDNDIINEYYRRA